VFRPDTMALRSLGFGLLVALFTGADSHAATCDSLKALSLLNSTITLAEPVAAGAFSPHAAPQSGLSDAAFAQLPAFCRVAATLKPSGDSEIRIEVWMPVANWNGRFQGVGNGGFAGFINERDLAKALERGYATASTDTGHTIDTLSDLGHPEKLVDFGYRAVHEMTVAAKTIVAGFYGSNPQRSYWNSCSTGGRQGLIEAQRFPADYDGIIAGSPANPQIQLAAWNVYVGKAALNDPAHTIPASKYAMIHQAVLNACDALDGVKDGIIGDPASCSFDFKTLACQGEDASTCLTAAQVETAQMVTRPLVHSRTGETIFPGLALGTELRWATKIGGPAPSPLGTDYFKHAVFKDPNWDWRTFDLESALALADKVDAGTTSATSPDLTDYKQRGGKLLLYHGWSDQNFSAQTTIAYYKRVLDKMGSVQSAEWLRLFLVPGMGHCVGGEGPNIFDALTALEHWVEDGKAPSVIVASHFTDGNVDRTRPLCPYPQVAKYQGTGSTDQAANFRCVMP
jgi:Tannase and feruloyl esterase